MSHFDHPIQNLLRLLAAMLLLVGCEDKSVNQRTGGGAASEILTSVYYGDYITGTAVASKQDFSLWSRFRYLVSGNNSCSKAAFAQLFDIHDFSNAEVPAPLAEVDLEGDGSFKFADLSKLSYDQNSPYIVRVSSCGKSFFRTITGSDYQDISVGSTMLAFASIESKVGSKFKKGAFDDDVRASFENLSHTLLDRGADTTSSKLYAELVSDEDMVAQFKSVFSTAPEQLRNMPPLITIMEIPKNLMEGETSNFNVGAVHWDISYKVSYLWKLDESEISVKNSFAYRPNGNMRRTYNLYLYIGSQEADGSVDIDKPYLTFTKVVNVSDDIPVTAPNLTIETNELSVDGDLIVSQNPFTVSIDTGANLKNCDSFSALLISEFPDSPDPIEDQFPVICGTANKQSVSVTLSDVSVGQRTLYLWAIDTVGNISPAKTAQFIFDPLTANVSLTNVPTGESNITNLDVTVGGTNITHYRYKIGTAAATDCSSEAGYSVEADISQNITDDISSLVDGGIRLCVLGKKSSGVWLSAASSAIAVWTKDTVPPTASISGVPTGTTAQVNLNVSVSGQGVTHYRYKVGLSAAVNCSDAAGYSANVLVSTSITNSISSEADGAMILCVLGVDAAGNVQDKDDATTAIWIKDTSAPTAIVASAPTGLQNVNLFNNLVVSGDRVATFKYKYGLAASTNCANSAGYNGDFTLSTYINIDTSALSDGAMNLCVVGKNIADVAQAYADATVYTWTKDTTPPTATITGAPTGTSNQTSLSVTIGGGGVVSYRYKVGPSSTTSCESSTGYLASTAVATQISANISSFSDVEVKLCVIGVDAAGNWQAYDDATVATWTKDTQTPTASIAGAPTGHSSATELEVTVTGAGADLYRYVLGPSADVDCAEIGDYSAAADIDDLLEVDISSLLDGSLSLCVIAGDDAGNWQDPSTAATATWTKDTEVPGDFTITAPSTEYVLTSTPTITWGAATGASSYKLIVSSVSNCATSVQAFNAVSGTLQVLNTIANGNYYICVTATDLAGNTKDADNAGLAFSVDANLPTSNFSSSTALGPNAVPNSTTTLLSGSASDVGSGLDKVEISIKNDTTNLCLNASKTAFDAACPQWNLVTGSTSWSFSIDDSVFNDANYSASSRATDVAGNVQSTLGSASLVWDSVVPEVTAVSITESSPTAKRSIQVNVTANDNVGGAGIQRVLVAERAASCASISNGQWFDWLGNPSQTLNYRLSQFSTLKNLCVFAQDASGNMSTISNSDLGTDGVDVVSITLNTPEGPEISSIVVTNAVNSSTTAIPGGTGAIISWSMTSAAGLAANPIVKIEFTYNAGYSWAKLPTAATPSSAYGSVTEGTLSWSSSYTGWNSPTNGIFQVRIVATDVNGTTTVGVSPPINAGKWSLWAGQNSVGNDGSATQALLGLAEVDASRAPFVVSHKTGHIFVYDANYGIRKIDGLTGIISSYIPHASNELPYRTNLAQDSLGYIYYHSLTGIRRFDPADLVASTTAYFEGGTELGDDIDASDLYLNPVAPVLAFDGSDNLYVLTTSIGAACDRASDGVLATTAYLYKVLRSGTSAGKAKLIFGNGSSGAPTYGNSANNEPFGISYCRNSTIAPNADGSIVYLAVQSPYDQHMKIVDGKIYRANLPDNVLPGAITFNPYTSSDKSFFFASGNFNPPDAKIYRFSPSTSNNGEVAEVFVGGGTGSNCNTDGIAPEDSCPSASGGMFVTPGNDLHWIDDRLPAAANPMYRIRTISAGKVQTVAGSTGLSGVGGSRLRAFFGSISELVKDSLGNIYAYDKAARYVLKFPKDIDTFSAVVGNGNNYVSTPALNSDAAGQNIGYAELYSTTLTIDQNDQLFFRGYMNGLYYRDTAGKLQRVGTANNSNNNSLSAMNITDTVVKTLRITFGTGATAVDDDGNIILGGGYWHSAALGGPPAILKINPTTGVITQLMGKWVGVEGKDSDASTSDGASAIDSTLRCNAVQNAWGIGKSCLNLNVRVYGGVIYYSEYDKIRTISATDGTGTLGTLKNADGTPLTLAPSVGSFAINGNRLYYLGDRQLYCAWWGTAATMPGDCNNTSLSPASGLPGISNIDRGVGLVIDDDGNVLVSAGQTILKYTP